MPILINFKRKCNYNFFAYKFDKIYKYEFYFIIIKILTVIKKICLIKNVASEKLWGNKCSCVRCHVSFIHVNWIVQQKINIDIIIFFKG